MIIVTTTVAPPVPIGFAPEPPVRHQTLFTGADGSLWDLTNGPVRLLDWTPGVPSPERWGVSPPALDGTIYTGMRTPQAEDVFTLDVHSDTGLGFRDLDSALARAFAPDGDCYLTIVAPDALSRTRRMRYSDGLDSLLTMDPFAKRSRVYEITMDSDPYWAGDTLSTTFTIAAEQAFFPGPPWNIASSHSIGQAPTVSNPGDIPVYPIARASGPFTGFTTGIGAAKVVYAGAKSATGWVLVDMTQQTITDDLHPDPADSDAVWLACTDIAFAPIPAGAAVQPTLDITDPLPGASVELSFTPLYRWPW
jgi:hypothetical protein